MKANLWLWINRQYWSVEPIKDGYMLTRKERVVYVRNYYTDDFARALRRVGLLPEK